MNRKERNWAGGEWEGKAKAKKQNETKHTHAYLSCIFFLIGHSFPHRPITSHSLLHLLFRTCPLWGQMRWTLSWVWAAHFTPPRNPVPRWACVWSSQVYCCGEVWWHLLCMRQDICSVCCCLIFLHVSPQNFFPLPSPSSWSYPSPLLSISLCSS